MHLRPQYFLESFIRLFVAIDPLGTLPIFLAMTTGISFARRRRREATFEAVGFALILCVGFMLLGSAIFRFCSISEADFKIARGVILPVLSMIDLLITGKPAVSEPATVGLFPLAMPLIAGHATLTTTLLLAKGENYGYAFTSLSLAINFGLLVLVILGANWFMRLMGINANW